MNKDLPFYSLFDSFRRNGYPLGIGEYEVLIEVLSARSLYEGTTAIILKEELLEICKILWLKPDQVPFVFESIFFGSYAKLVRGKKEGASGTQPFTDKNKITPEPTELIEQPEKPSITEADPEEPAGNKDAGKTPLSIKSEANFFRIVLGSLSAAQQSFRRERAVVTERKFLFSESYFPVSIREIEQLFNFLPEKKRQKNHYEMDIDATILAIAKNGYLTEVVFKKYIEVTNHLLILKDNNESMTGFEKLADTISKATNRVFANVGSRSKVNTEYYFKDTITNYIYLNKSSTLYTTTADFVSSLKEKKVMLAIVSDAGAARAGNSNARVRETIGMLMKLKKVTSKIVWLNPFPAERWKNTSAERVSNFVPMFTIDKHGMQNAVNVLRGKSYKTPS